MLNLATDLWGIQTIGALTSAEQFSFLCTNFSLTRLAEEGYNATSLHTIFCSAADAYQTSLPSESLIQNLVAEYSTQIWVTQAIGAMGNDIKKIKVLCKLFDVDGANSVGQNGTFAKNEICAAANGTPVPLEPVPVFPNPVTLSEHQVDAQQVAIGKQQQQQQQQGQQQQQQ